MFKTVKKWLSRHFGAKDFSALIDEAFLKGQLEVLIIADSISEHGKRITTFQLKYWLPMHAEFMTHRAFGRNAASNRAIPIAKIIKQVWNNPAYPIWWGKNQSGMQAKEQLSFLRIKACRFAWKWSGRMMCAVVYSLMKLGLHKQTANRLLMPWQFMHVVVTSTDYGNFFELRCHEDAQPEIYAFACRMRQLMKLSKPKQLEHGEWHLPYIREDEREAWDEELLKDVSAARCCRVSYLNHQGQRSTVEKDLALCDRLVGSRPLHASPFEHQATPDIATSEGEYLQPELHGNLNGWVQNRKLVEKRVYEL